MIAGSPITDGRRGPKEKPIVNVLHYTWSPSVITMVPEFNWIPDLELEMDD